MKKFFENQSYYYKCLPYFLVLDKDYGCQIFNCYLKAKYINKILFKYYFKL